MYNITCPYCGAEQDGILDCGYIDDYVNSEMEYDCEVCEKPMIISAEVEFIVQKDEEILKQRQEEEKVENPEDPNQIRLI